MKPTTAQMAAPVPTMAMRPRISGNAFGATEASCDSAVFAARARSVNPQPPYAAAATKPAASHDKLGYCHNTRPALTAPPIAVVHSPARDRDRAWLPRTVNRFSLASMTAGGSVRRSAESDDGSVCGGVVIVRLVLIDVNQRQSSSVARLKLSVGHPGSKTLGIAYRVFRQIAPLIWLRDGCCRVARTTPPAPETTADRRRLSTPARA